jgi:hypothetical protein
MSRSRCLSTISLVALAACDGDDGACGPGDAPADGITITGSNVALRYDSFDSGVNNDCTVPAAGGKISVTIHAKQVGGAAPLTFCISRVDLFGKEPLDLAKDDPNNDDLEFRVVDASGMDAGCTFELADAPITGTATAEGVCADASDPAGYALTVNGSLTLTRTCGVTVDAVAVTLAGTVAVAGQ